MFRAMALKELRETRGIVLLAMAGYIWLLWFQVAQLLKWRPQTMPFVDDGFLFGYLWVSCGLAIAIGMAQTLGESIPGTYPFLFHRPATRRWLIGTKILVGIVSYLVCSLVPILIYGAVAATHGTHASPFTWAMAGEAFLVWLSISVLYFGAFLSGIRPGRWFYSRLFPLGGAGLIALLPLLLCNGIGLDAAVSVAPLLLIDAILVAVILLVARTCDYS